MAQPRQTLNKLKTYLSLHPSQLTIEDIILDILEVLPANVYDLHAAATEFR